jgi:hypothetical protein
MDQDKSYGDYIDQVALLKDRQITRISVLTNIKSVSSNIGDLIDNLNYPLVVVFNDELDLDNSSAIFSVSLKNKGSDTSDNDALVKEICGTYEEFTFGGNCLRARITKIENYIDTTSAAKMEVKSIITRIEVEVDL